MAYNGLYVLSDSMEGWQDTCICHLKGSGVSVYQIFGIALQKEIHLEFTVDVQSLTYPVYPGFGR